MHRQSLLQGLRNFRALLNMGRLTHRSYNEAEEFETIRKFEAFVGAHERCFERDNFAGHVTGSALVTNPDFSSVLLTLHGKLNIWLQLGGHADGDPDVARVALREAWEESGVKQVSLFDLAAWAQLNGSRDQIRELDPNAATPFDLDVHPIPARKSDPEHLHFDVRFLVIADDKQPLAITDESHDLRWVPVPEARKLTQERSMVRQFDKLELLAPDGRAGRIPTVPAGRFDL